MGAPASDAWLALERPWRVALGLAWEAYGAGTIPVGAALADGAGEVVATGRNRVYEPRTSRADLAGSLLAHAEVTALVQLDPARRYEDHVLYTSLEPCALCVSATVMATVGAIRYAGADPYGGGDGVLTGSNAHLERVPVSLAGPRVDEWGRFAWALLLAFFLERNPSGHVVRAFDQAAPDLRSTAETLVAIDAARLAGRQALEQSLDLLRPCFQLPD